MKSKMYVLKSFVLFLFTISFTFFAPSCKTGQGCEMTEHYRAQNSGEGELSTKRGKSNLFSKKKRKKMNR